MCIQTRLHYWRSNLRLTHEQLESFCQYLNPNEGVHQHADGTFWWYDETQADEFGGFETFEEALASLIGYCKQL